MPESKRPTTTKRLTRGTMPTAVGVAIGEMTLTGSPTSSPSWRATSLPTMMPGSSTVAPRPSSSGTSCSVAELVEAPSLRWRSQIEHAAPTPG